jgi:hypothetical protein
MQGFAAIKLTPVEPRFIRRQEKPVRHTRTSMADTSGTGARDKREGLDWGQR